MKNGAMKMMPDSVISTPALPPAACPEPAMPNRISMASAFFRKLSLRAEQNWHQNSGANRRVVIRLLNMNIPNRPRPSHLGLATAAFHDTPHPLSELWPEKETSFN